METSKQRWAGHLYGTNTGNLYVELQVQGGDVKGLVRLLDPVWGLAVFDAAGTFKDGQLRLECTLNQGQEGVEYGTLSVDGQMGPEGNIRGDWASTLGTAGTFAIFPHGGEGGGSPDQPGLPERLHTASRGIGALRLYADDVRELIQAVGRDFRTPRPVVTYTEHGLEVSRYADDFVADMARIGELRGIRIVAQENEAYGINRSVMVELSAQGENQVRVQGVQDTWVQGKAETLAQLLRRRQKPLVTGVRRWGLNVNTLIALGSLVALPELEPIWARASFLAVVVLVIFLVSQLHARLIPSAVLHLSPKSPGWFDKVRPQVVDWLIAATSGILVSLAYGLLKGEIHLPSGLP